MIIPRSWAAVLNTPAACSLSRLQTAPGGMHVGALGIPQAPGEPLCQTTEVASLCFPFTSASPPGKLVPEAGPRPPLLPDTAFQLAATPRVPMHLVSSWGVLQLPSSPAAWPPLLFPGPVGSSSVSLATAPHAPPRRCVYLLEGELLGRKSEGG